MNSSGPLFFSLQNFPIRITQLIFVEFKWIKWIPAPSTTNPSLYFYSVYLHFTIKSTSAPYANSSRMFNPAVHRSHHGVRQIRASVPKGHRPLPSVHSSQPFVPSLAVSSQFAKKCSWALKYLKIFFKSYWGNQLRKIAKLEIGYSLLIHKLICSCRKFW